MADHRVPLAVRKVKETALTLHTYMTYRAEREGVKHTFPVSFYEEALSQGCISFFGVRVRNWRVVADEQQPEMFFDWNAETTLVGSTDLVVH